jgi:hypothetical protein
MSIDAESLCQRDQGGVSKAKPAIGIALGDRHRGIPASSDEIIDLSNH